MIKMFRILYNRYDSSYKRLETNYIFIRPPEWNPSAFITPYVNIYITLLLLLFLSVQVLGNLVGSYLEWTWNIRSYWLTVESFNLRL